MQQLINNIKGDRSIWAIAALLAVLSFLPVYSASSNLAYTNGDGNTFGYFVKHFVHLFLGFFIIYAVHRIPYRYFRGLSNIFIYVVLLLLVITLLQGTTIGGANASRWIKVPFVGFTFQTSAFASVVLMVYVARYLSKIHSVSVSFKETILPLWLPVFCVLALILPANLSTATIIFAMVVLAAFIGGYPLRYLGIVVGGGALVLAFFVLTVMAFPDLMENRVDTWKSRVDEYLSNEDKGEAYQIEKAKIAIASGGVKGLGPGKSIQKNFLPQSSSDFIYAIIVEEYGLFGGLFLLFMYLWMLFRIVIVSQKADTVFGKLIVIGVGLPIVFQALINMAVAVGLIPVTGQTLPLISSGGTSIWMTCLSIGIVLSVSARRQDIKAQEADEGEVDNPLGILAETI
ncbi:MAG: FtsW/RodA/SpoVE family cell cycle protein [Flavobacteriaceae bacterium]|nr:FtsW/RodA/SpoVE family cell cycle protein [Flavobacteriaceae bacterium]